MASVAVIGGTGAEFFPQDGVSEQGLADNAWGSPSAGLRCWEQEGHRIVFLARHGTAGIIPPHRVNYRANMALLASESVDCIIALNAVGGISSEARAGRLVIPDQLIDYSSGRAHTIYDGDASELNFVDFTQPYDETVRLRLLAAARDANLDAMTPATYAVTQGPRLETPAEINRLEKDGCHIVGMTAMPEAVLAREFGLAYASCCIVVNAAAGRSDAPIHGEMASHVEAGMGSAATLFASFLAAL